MALKSDACEHIASITAGNSTTSTYSFSGIPQTYKHLQVIGSISTDGYTDYLLIWFNDDTSSYTYCSAYGDTSGEPSVLYNGSVTYAYVGWFSSFTHCKGNIELWVPNYTSTTHYKAGITQMGSFNTDYSSSFAGGFHWNEYDQAVTKITFKNYAHNFMGGSGDHYSTRFDLYGWT